MAGDSVWSLALVRHGDTDASKTRRLLGRSDIPLSPDGIKQAHDLATKVTREFLTQEPSRDVVVFSSPLTRARQTAEIVCRAFGSHLHVHNGLAERNFGSWTNRTLSELSVLDPKTIERFRQDPLSVSPPLSEGLDDFKTRVLGAFQAAIELAESRIPVVIVTHDGPLRVLIRQLQPTSRLPDLYGIPPCGCARLRMVDNGPTWIFSRPSTRMVPFG